MKLEPRECETREVGPVTKLTGVTTNPDPLGVGGSVTIEDEEHEPSWRTDTSVRGSDDGASGAIALECGEDVARAHGVTVGARGS